VNLDVTSIIDRLRATKVCPELVVALDEQPTETVSQQVCPECGSADIFMDKHLTGSTDFYYDCKCRACRANSVTSLWSERSVPLETLPRADLTVEQWRFFAPFRSTEWASGPEHPEVQRFYEMGWAGRRSHRVGEATGGRCYRVLVVDDADDRKVSEDIAVIETDGSLWLWHATEDERDVSHWLEQVPDLKPGQWVAVFDSWSLAAPTEEQRT
jgi:hypothetical protein